MEETAPETPGSTKPEAADIPETKPGVDKLLVGLCAVLWVTALVVLFVKAPGMRVDWQLGNLKQALDANGIEGIDEAIVENLVELAKSTDVVGMIRTELEDGAQFDPYSQDKILYRVALVQVLTQIPGEPAFEAIRVAGQDPDPRVRRFSYIALRGRVDSELSERRDAAVAIMENANREVDLVSRVVAIQQIADLDALPADLDTRLLGAWPFVNGLREARSGDTKTPNSVIRMACLQGLKALIGESQEIAYDPKAELALRDEQLAAFEAWYEAQGGKRPENVPPFAEWRASLDEPQKDTDDAPPSNPNQGSSEGTGQ